MRGVQAPGAPTPGFGVATRPPRAYAERQLAARRRTVRIAKYVLPIAALTLLSSIAMWPELMRTIENGQATWRRLSLVEAGTGEIVHPRYRGTDGQNRPYVVSAETAHRASAERVELNAPRGDLTMPNGAWLQVQSRQGVFVQHANQLDLSGDVTLYRQDGTVMTTAAATLDLKQNAAASSEFTHAEGPFGTLDAQGFTLVDKGSVIQFHGPAKLVLNGKH